MKSVVAFQDCFSCETVYSCVCSCFRGGKDEFWWILYGTSSCPNSWHTKTRATPACPQGFLMICYFWRLLDICECEMMYLKMMIYYTRSWYTTQLSTRLSKCSHVFPFLEVRFAFCFLLEYGLQMEDDTGMISIYIKYDCLMTIHRYYL